MSKRSLLEEFEVRDSGIKVNNISDYEVFSDKNLLDNLRNKIIQNLIDENIPNLNEKNYYTHLNFYPKKNINQKKYRLTYSRFVLEFKK